MPIVAIKLVLANPSHPLTWFSPLGPVNQLLCCCVMNHQLQLCIWAPSENPLGVCQAFAVSLSLLSTLPTVPVQCRRSRLPSGVEVSKPTGADLFPLRQAASQPPQDQAGISVQRESRRMRQHSPAAREQENKQLPHRQGNGCQHQRWELAFSSPQEDSRCLFSLHFPSISSPS